jgi:GNAT superfamily N-acetyltransferase
VTDQLPLVAALAAARAVAPPGVEIRPWRDERDYAAMIEVFHHARVVDGTGWELSVDGLVSDLRALGTRAEDSILIADVDGGMVGWIRIWDFGRSPDEGRQLMHSGQVEPAWRRRGIGRALVKGAQVELERIWAAGHDPAGTTAGIHVWLFARNTTAIALLEADGYRRLRYVVEMTRDLDDLPATDLPAGVTTHPVLPQDRAAIVRAMDEAMRDHRGWPEWSDEQLMGLFDHPIRGQLDVWQVAWQGERVVGGVLGYIDTRENEVMHRQRGYTEAIFTIREWRSSAATCASCASAA